uniref:JmjC domain-containing protein n=1 Tax=Panagrolaimus superbus TaxID=310955 RepID=A0A914Z887_9BILA
MRRTTLPEAADWCRNEKGADKFPFFIIRTDPLFWNLLRMKKEAIPKDAEVVATRVNVKELCPGFVEAISEHLMQMENQLKLSETEGLFLFSTVVDRSNAEQVQGFEYKEHLNFSLIHEIAANNEDFPHGWNMNQLPGQLTELLQGDNTIFGVSTSMIYSGELGTGSVIHVENFDLASANIVFPNSAGKAWIGINPGDEKKLTELISKNSHGKRRNCCSPLLHVDIMIDPKFLDDNEICWYYVVQNPGDIVITNPRGLHQVHNLGYNLAEATNFICDGWKKIARRRKACQCPGRTNLYKNREPWEMLADFVYDGEIEFFEATDANATLPTSELKEKYKNMATTEPWTEEEEVEDEDLGELIVEATQEKDLTPFDNGSRLAHVSPQPTEIEDDDCPISSKKSRKNVIESSDEEEEEPISIEESMAKNGAHVETFNEESPQDKEQPESEESPQDKEQPESVESPKNKEQPESGESSSDLGKSKREEAPSDTEMSEREEPPSDTEKSEGEGSPSDAKETAQQTRLEEIRNNDLIQRARRAILNMNTSGTQKQIAADARADKISQRRHEEAQGRSSQRNKRYNPFTRAEEIRRNKREAEEYAKSREEARKLYEEKNPERNVNRSRADGPMSSWFKVRVQRCKRNIETAKPRIAEYEVTGKWFKKINFAERKVTEEDKLEMLKKRRLLYNALGKMYYRCPEVLQKRIAEKYFEKEVIRDFINYHNESHRDLLSAALESLNADMDYWNNVFASPDNWNAEFGVDEDYRIPCIDWSSGNI